MGIVDLHCDTISAAASRGLSLRSNQLQWDLDRAKNAQLKVQFCALFSLGGEGCLRWILKQVEYFHKQLEKENQAVYLVKSYTDILNSSNRNKVAAILHLEGGDSLGADLEILHLLQRLGLRSLGLTWNHRNLLADGVSEDPGAGLSKAGKLFVQELKKLNMILDLAHAAPRSFYEAMELYGGPVMVSHANARALCNHPRNLDDVQLRKLADADGIIGVTLVPEFVRYNHAKIEDLLDHVVYIAELIGVHHLALGSDFDGSDDMLMPGIESYQDWNSLLTSRGFSAADIDLILQGNALRFLENVLV
ncbi:dipeptidase [Syntrophomonas palmitatica]|uniref:dipeptidase n=1 Tax=Syntrophomonas palmitatica TaxID=402877 RepID=UPI0006D04717|nr:dipeptidase [Syntrophomonas palmitatica]